MIVGISVITLFLSVYMAIRNQCVYIHHTKKLEEASARAKQIIADGNSWDWEKGYDEYYSVSYEQMMRKFWVWPLEKFYKETEK